MNTGLSDAESLRSEAITAFRLGREGEGSAALVKYIDAIVPWMECNGALLGADEVALLNEIIAAQQRCDYLFVADLLEYLLPQTALGATASPQ